MNPGWDSDWWGRDPIEQAGDPPMTSEPWEPPTNDTYNEFDPGFRLGTIIKAAEYAFADLLEASPWLARQFLDECEEKLTKPRKQSA
jgi:hypothetical protein